MSFRYKPDDKQIKQFAVAVNFPEDQCANFKVDTELRKNVKNALTKKKLYIGNNVVAARPIRSINNNKDCDKHAEYILLANQYVKNLLNINRGDCAVFYTYISPCLKYCMNTTNDNRCIVSYLSDAFKNYSGTKALVFTEVSGDAKNNPYNTFRTINSIIPLYRCNANSCIKCFQDDNLSADCKSNFNINTN